jgi:CBS domain-containing protein
MKVKEIMKSPVITVNKDITVKECGDLLQEHGINGAPVVDDEHVVGLITRADIFRSILPRYPDIFKDERHLVDFEYMEERIKKVTRIEVSELMGSPAMTLDQETPIVKAGSIMILRKIKQMPVVKDDKLVGIISLEDVFRYLMEKAGKS